MRRLTICVVTATVLLLAGACVPAGPAPCSGIWCEVVPVGIFGGTQIRSYPTSVTNAGDVLLTSYQPLADPTVVPGARNLYLYHRASQTYTRLGVGGGTADGTISPDGRWVAMWEHIGSASTVSLLDLVAHTSRVISTSGVDDPTDFGQAPTAAPQVSPDGQLVAWSNNFGSGCTRCLDAVLWSAATDTTSVIATDNFGWPRSLDAQGAYIGDSYDGVHALYVDIVNHTSDVNTPIHAHPAPPLSSVDGRYWATVGSTISVLDTTTNTTTDLGLPPGFAPLGPARAFISGDGHHVVVSDLLHIWEQDI